MYFCTWVYMSESSDTEYEMVEGMKLGSQRRGSAHSHFIRRVKIPKKKKEKKKDKRTTAADFAAIRDAKIAKKACPLEASTSAEAKKRPSANQSSRPSTSAEAEKES